MNIAQPKYAGQFICYGCGKQFSDEAIALLIDFDEKADDAGYVTAINAASADHVRCFE